MLIKPLWCIVCLVSNETEFCAKAGFSVFVICRCCPYAYVYILHVWYGCMSCHVIQFRFCFITDLTMVKLPQWHYNGGAISLLGIVCQKK